MEFLDHIERLADGQWGRSARAHAHARLRGGGRRRQAPRAEQMDLRDVPARWVVPSAEEAGVVNGYDHPSRLGADRWWL